MMTAIVWLAALLIAFAVTRIPKRPGFFGGIMVCSFGLTPIIGSVGPPFAVVAISASIIRLMSRKTEFLPCEAALAVWCSLMALSILWSTDIDATFTELAELFLLAVGTYLYARAYSLDENFLSDFLASVIPLTILSFAAVVLTQKGVGLRLGSQDVPPVGLALMPEVGIVCCIGMLLFRRMAIIWRLVLIAAVIGLFIPFAIGTGTRSVLLSTAIVVMVYTAYLASHGRGKIVLGLSAALVAFGVLAYLFLPLILGSAGGTVFANTFGRVLILATVGVAADSASLARLDFYHQALSLFQDAPLFGYGIAAFGYMADGVDAAGVYPHNMFLEIMVDGGLVGLILFLLFLVPPLLFSIRNMFRPGLSWETLTITGLLISALIRHQISMSILEGKLLFFALGCTAARMALPAATLYRRERTVPAGNLGAAG